MNSRTRISNEKNHLYFAIFANCDKNTVNMETSILIQEIMTGIVCALLFVGLSYFINRRLSGDSFKVDVYLLIMHAVTLFCLAIFFEPIINRLYYYFVGEKLWQYQVMPVYGRDVSLLSPLLWSAYGMHIYFIEQTYLKHLPRFLRNRKSYALLHGLDAPLIFEVSGNLVFLLLIGKYYAYYLPGDLFHLTSVRVIPLYILCIFFGLLLLHWLEKQKRHWAIPGLIFSSGIGFLYLA